MEYISAEEFLKQPKEVQEVFLNWWKPSIGDLFSWVKNDDEYEHDLRKLECCNSDNIVEMTESFKGIHEGDRIPLLTEGQLRKFIEDKTCGISSMYFKCNNIRINIYDNNKGTCIREFKNLGADLLQAYWKVAVEIASSEVNKHEQLS